MGGYAQTCYSVTATVNGKDVSGCLLGAAHPDVAAFEREVRSHIPPIPPPAPADAQSKEDKDKGPAPVPPKSFAGLSGISPVGHPVSLASLNQPTLVLHFWSASGKKSIHEADEMEGVYNQYRGKGVGLVGVVSGSSTAQVRRVMSEEEVVWPQIFDSGAIAARYPQTKDLKYFILDQNRDVVAALKSSDDVQRALNAWRKQTGGSR
jgi:hypothetical protein